MNTRRIAAATAVVLVVGVAVATVTAIAGEVPRVLAQLALFVVVLAIAARRCARPSRVAVAPGASVSAQPAPVSQEAQR